MTQASIEANTHVPDGERSEVAYSSESFLANLNKYISTNKGKHAASFLPSFSVRVGVS
jgi:hypothetical protein